MFFQPTSVEKRYENVLIFIGLLGEDWSAFIFMEKFY